MGFPGGSLAQFGHSYPYYKVWDAWKHQWRMIILLTFLNVGDGSCWEAWRAANGVAKSRTQLSYWTALNWKSLCFPGCSVVNNPPTNAGDAGAAGSIPGSGRSPVVGHNNPLHYSCLENSRDRGVWWAAVHGFPKS